MKQLKSCTPYRLTNDTFFKWLGAAASPPVHHLFAEKVEGAFLHSVDPSGSQWGTLGMVHPIDAGSYVHELDGVARMLMFQFNDRILPGPVRDEKLRERVREIEQRDGHKIGKKGYAELREQVEEDMLPNSHIRRTLVPVLVYKDMLLIFTTSAKKLDDIFVKLMKLAGLKATVQFEPQGVRYKEGIHFILKQIAGGASAGDDDQNYALEAMTAIKLQGADKRTISIKDRDIFGDEVQKLLVGDTYSVIEMLMQLSLTDSSEDVLVFTFNDKGQFKNIKMDDTVMAGLTKEDLHSTAWMMAKQIKELLMVVTEALGGLDVDDEL